MDYLHRAVNYVNFLRKNTTTSARKEQQEVKEEEWTRIDGYLNYVCKVICWEDPTLTWISFLFINAVYLFIVAYEIRFFCVIFSTIAIMVTLDYYDKSLNFKHLKRYVYFKNIKQRCLRFIYNMHSWKRENPSLFCGVMITFFLSLSIIGRTVSGRSLLYFIILGSYFSPQLYQLVPRDIKSTVNNVATAIWTNEGVIDENDLIPLLSAENDFSDDLDSILNENTQDSATNSLISGASTMPSHMDVDLDELDEADLLPTNNSKVIRDVDFSTTSSSGDSSDYENNEMQFKALHFKKDSSSNSGSSDEERLLSKSVIVDNDGSLLAEAAAGPIIGRALGAGMYQSLAAIGSNLLSNYMPSQTNNTSSGSSRLLLAKSDSDSDFEIISAEDANNAR